MNPLSFPAVGALLGFLWAGACLSVHDPGWGIQVPLLFLYPWARRHHRAALAFALTLSAGIVVGKGALEGLPLVTGWTEVLSLLALTWLPRVIERRTSGEEGRLLAALEDRRAERAALENALQEEKRVAGQSTQQLRSVEHLFDVMREAGTTLNVQEMLTLAQEFTERMFRFRHFVLAMESSDGGRFEVRASSGCDELSLRQFHVDRKSGMLAARLAESREPLYVPDTFQDARWAHLAEASVRSFVFVPFAVRERAIGFLCSHSRQVSLLDEDRFQNLQVFGNQVAIGLQKALLYEKVQQLSITDGLTRLHSYRYFRQRLDEELVLAKRYGSQLALLILDIDHFKRYNDTYGHLAGDQVLQEVGRLLRSCAEASHLTARYGGEEMVLLAPETNRAEAGRLAEKIRDAVEARDFPVGKDSTKVTVSVGVGMYPTDARDALDLVGRADKALYAAKESGRNKTVLYAPHMGGAEKRIDTPPDRG